jgi:hypothetical protein
VCRAGTKRYYETGELPKWGNPPERDSVGLLHCSPPCQSLSKLNSHSDAALIEEKHIPLLDQVCWSHIIRCGNSADQQDQAFALLASLSSTVRLLCSPSEVQKVLQARTFFAESIQGYELLCQTWPSIIYGIYLRECQSSRPNTMAARYMGCLCNEWVAIDTLCCACEATLHLCVRLLR